MKLERLYLRNYRVYEDPVELDMPSGLLGVYGPNGAGKSALLESILFALWGKARTAKDEIRTAGVTGDCIVEVTFEHEGHLYLVRRTISGHSATVRAEAHVDGALVSEGVRDTTQYVHSVLGMDDAAFRASVFAEQKQLAAFSDNTPAERRRLVLRLLGVTPLDAARDDARRDARERREQLDRLRQVLANLDELSQGAAAAEQAAAAAGEAAEAEAERAKSAAEGAEAAEAEAERLGRLGAAYQELVAEGKTRSAELESKRAVVTKLEVEERELAGAEERLRRVGPMAEGVEDLERALVVARAVADAEAALAGLPPATEVARPDPAAVGVLRSEAEEARRALGELEGQWSAAVARRDQVTAEVERSSALSAEEDCPLCGQALGGAFEQVQAHRKAELAEATDHARRLESRRVELARAAKKAAAAVKAAEARLQADQEAWMSAERSAALRTQAVERLEAARSAAAGMPVVVVEGVAIAADAAAVGPLGQELERRRQAADECARLRGRLGRRDAVLADLSAERARVTALLDQVEGLREKVRDLGFDPAQLDSARQAAKSAREAATTASAAANQAQVRAAEARGRAEGEAKRLEDARAQHGHAEELETEVRHLGRVAELLGTFRNTVVSSIGPRLSAQAAELFAELTDREYDQLEVDPETYEVQIRDQGFAYGMDRYSGSETDLANLALRVAISEQIRFQSGGAVGLLVLDELFGPLDEDRKERMLAALERLRGRFRQILVVTHDRDVKEQLPGAIEVVKLPGRRARARVL